MSFPTVSILKQNLLQVYSLGKDYNFVRVNSPKKGLPNNLGGYSIEITNKTDCSTKRYVLSLIATVGTLGFALVSSSIRNAVFYKTYFQKKVIPIKLESDESKFISNQSHNQINELWKKNISDPTLNKLKLLELESNHANVLTHKLVKALEKKDSLKSLTCFDEIYTFEDLVVFKHYLIASHPKLSEKEKAFVVQQLKDSSPLFRDEVNSQSLEKFITDFTVKSIVRFDKKAQIKIVEKNQSYSPEQDIFVASEVNFNDRFMTYEEYRKRELYYRGPTESTVRQTVNDFLMDKKPLQVVFDSKTNFAELDKKENITYDQLLNASMNKLTELSVTHNVHGSYTRYLPLQITNELIGLLQNNKSISSALELKHALQKKMVEVNEHQYQFTVEEFGLLIKKKDRLFIYNDVFFSPDGASVVKEYKELIEQYKKDLKSYEENPALEKPKLQWKEGDQKLIRLIALDAPLLEKANIVIDAFFDDPEVVSLFAKIIPA